MNRTIPVVVSAVIFVLAGILSSCGEDASKTLEVVSGSENKTLEPLIQEFARKNGCKVSLFTPRDSPRSGRR